MFLLYSYCKGGHTFRGHVRINNNIIMYELMMRTVRSGKEERNGDNGCCYDMGQHPNGGGGS